MKVLKFLEKKNFKPDIFLNTEIETKAENTFPEKKYKSMSNNLSGKTVENVRKNYQ